MELKGKKVLVTGAEGFIGSHLIEALVRKGAQVTGFVLYNSFNSWGWIDTFNKDIRNQLKIVTGDVRDKSSINQALKGIDVVFHLAALIAIPYSYRAPESYIDTNIKGTINVLEACRENNIQKIIHTSTSEVYGTAQYIPIDEQHPLQAQSPYAASKISADMIVQSYYKSFDLPAATIRPFNTYGPRQSARAIIPTVILQILFGKKVIELGTLHPTRDFNYVKDTVEGFIKIAESENTVGTVTNIGIGKEITIEDLVKRIIILMDKEVQIICKDERKRPDKSEVERLCADNTKAKILADWKPRYSLDEGLRETIEWMKKNTHLYKSDMYNI